MRPIFQPRLVNGPFADPALYVDLLFERRALLFDLGDIGSLPPRKLLRISHVFVTHTHMDHFVGFDRLLRVCLGRNRPLALFGPPGFVDQVQHRLASYTWNLVENYNADLAIAAFEVSLDGSRMSRADFNSRDRFARRDGGTTALEEGLLLKEPAFRVRCAVLDHQIPCLGFALQEATHVNVWCNRLAELGLAPGAWLRGAKHAIMTGAPDDTMITARWPLQGAMHEQSVPLGTLRRAALQCVPGEKLAYVSDVAAHAENERRIVQLAAGADILFIEATFLEQDALEARRKSHLTAHDAGRIARAAGARELMPFHFSPRYTGLEPALSAEARAAFRGDGP
ncbi:MAG TPA: MBL fold metallo-hydrolase [Steroidobacteraceae bacterium]|nr:MBL fold metallo-hydrolase [Steroidobacteraceae bacterium]